MTKIVCLKCGLTKSEKKQNSQESEFSRGSKANAPAGFWARMAQNKNATPESGIASHESLIFSVLRVSVCGDVDLSTRKSAPFFERFQVFGEFVGVRRAH